MWFMVCRWPQSQEGDWVRRHLCKLARHQREQWSSWTRRVTSTCLVQFMYCAQTFICLQIFSTCSNFKFSVAVSLESSRIQLTPPLDPTRLSSRVVPRHVGSGDDAKWSLRRDDVVDACIPMLRFGRSTRTELAWTPATNTSIQCECSHRTKWLSTKRPSFLAAYQVVTIYTRRVTGSTQVWIKTKSGLMMQQWCRVD